MTITLPDELKVRLESLAKLRGFATVNEYLLDLVLQELTTDLEDDYEPSDIIVSQLTPRNRAELEAMLEEGMRNGDPIRVDEAFWAERRRVLQERLSLKAESSS
jgi:hypothetical protein